MCLKVRLLLKKAFEMVRDGTGMVVASRLRAFFACTSSKPCEFADPEAHPGPCLETLCWRRWHPCRKLPCSTYVSLVPVKINTGQSWQDDYSTSASTFSLKQVQRVQGGAPTSPSQADCGPAGCSRARVDSCTNHHQVEHSRRDIQHFL